MRDHGLPGGWWYSDAEREALRAQALNIEGHFKRLGIIDDDVTALLHDTRAYIAPAGWSPRWRCNNRYPWRRNAALERGGITLDCSSAFDLKRMITI
ncbi:hypothetical protein ACFL1S_05880 [Pseudomonadota bacterium]